MGRLSLPGSLPELRTPRLRLRPATPDDVGTLFAGLNADPVVMEFLLGRAATPAETATEWAERFGERTDVGRGLGYWAGFDIGTEQDSFVGWWAVSAYRADPGVGVLGYRMPRSAWGRGLATEGSRALLAHAWTDTDVDVVRASTMAVNERSRAVMKRLGMAHVDTEFGVHHADWGDPLPGSELGEVVYEVTRPPAS